jgi:hypothetical protein
MVRGDIELGQKENRTSSSQGVSFLWETFSNLSPADLVHSPRRYFWGNKHPPVLTPLKEWLQAKEAESENAFLLPLWFML